MAGSGAASLLAQSPDTWDRPPLVAARRTLANGLRVVLAENHTVPLVWLNWVCQAGFEWDSPALAGVAAMTPGLLREGTAHRSADDITEDVDDLGANLVAGADWDAAFLNLDLLSADFAAGAELLLDMACHPRFPEAAVARACQRQLEHPCAAVVGDPAHDVESSRRAGSESHFNKPRRRSTRCSTGSTERRNASLAYPTHATLLVRSSGASTGVPAGLVTMTPASMAMSAVQKSYG